MNKKELLFGILIIFIVVSYMVGEINRIEREALEHFEDLSDSEYISYFPISDLEYGDCNKNPPKITCSLNRCTFWGCPE